jgi:hypothetical protein
MPVALVPGAVGRVRCEIAGQRTVDRGSTKVAMRDLATGSGSPLHSRKRLEPFTALQARRSDRQITESTRRSNG